MPLGAGTAKAKTWWIDTRRSHKEGSRDESAANESVGDIRCLLEARPTGQDPVVVTHHAESVAAALGGATDKLDALLASKLDRRRENKGGDTIRGAARP